MLVTAPFVLLLLDFWPLDRLRTAAQRRRAVLEKLPMLVAVGAVAAVTVGTQGGVGAFQAGESFPLDARLANAVASYASYLSMAAWPVDLAIFYPHPHPRGGLGVARLAASAVLLLSITALALGQARRRPHLLTGWLWYLGMLVPVIGIVQVGMQAMADRYTYLPLTGVGIAVAWEASRLATRLPVLRAPVLVAGLILLAAWTGISRQQLGAWRDGAAVFRQAVAVDERNAVAHNGLGFALLEQERLEEAIGHLRRAIEIRPDLTDAHVNLGVALVRAGRPGDALRHLRRGLDLPPHRLARVHGNLGLAYQRTGRRERAEEHYRKALGIDEKRAAVHMNLASLLVDQGRAAEAERHLRRAEKLGMESPPLHFSRALLAQRSGRFRSGLRAASVAWVGVTL